MGRNSLTIIAGVVLFIGGLVICADSSRRGVEPPKDSFGGSALWAKEQFDVLILGGGIAGIKAAATLFDGGVRNIAVLEQSSRIGGRMWQRQWQGEVIELGANWIEGIPQDLNPIWGISQKIGLKGNYTSQEDEQVEPTLYDVHGKVPKKQADRLHQQLIDAMNGALQVYCYRARRHLPDITLREALTSVGWPTPDKQTPLQRTLEFFVVDWDFEYSPDEVSLINFYSVGKKEADSRNMPCSERRITRLRPGRGFGWEAPRYFITDPRGYAAVVDHLAEPILKDDRQRLLLNKSVTSITYDAQGGDGVRVETADGHSYTAKRAIVTFSSSVITFAAKSGTLFFPPLPPWKVAAYNRAGNGVYTKVFAKYTERFWHNADYVLFAHPTRRGHYAVWQDLESHHKFFPAGTNMLMVTVVQADSERVERQSKNQTIRELQDVLRLMYGPGIPEPVDIFVPRWNADPHFRGCWSNIQVGTTKAHFDDMQAELGGLSFAGEATDFNFNGFTLGGYNSGLEVASRVLKSMNGRGRLASATSTFA